MTKSLTERNRITINVNINPKKTKKRLRIIPNMNKVTTRTNIKYFDLTSLEGTNKFINFNKLYNNIFCLRKLDLEKKSNKYE